MQEAPAWRGDFCPPSNCSRMMRQFMDASGALEKSDNPGAEVNVEVPRPATSPTVSVLACRR